MWELFKRNIRDILAFIGAVIIPATAWFTILRHDVSSLASRYSEDKLAYANRFVDIEFKQQDIKDKILIKIDDINKTLYRIEGEIKRIQ